jgi:hypothetical protein
VYCRYFKLLFTQWYFAVSSKQDCSNHNERTSFVAWPITEVRVTLVINVTSRSRNTSVTEKVKSNRWLWPFILPLVLRVFNPPTVTVSDSKFTSDMQGMVQTVVDSLMSAARKFSCLNSSVKNLSPCEYWQVNSNLFILIMTVYSHNNTIQAQKWRRNSAVVIVTMLSSGYLSNLGLICAGSKRFFSSPKRASRPAVPPLKLPTSWPQGMFIPG